MFVFFLSFVPTCLVRLRRATFRYNDDEEEEEEEEDDDDEDDDEDDDDDYGGRYERDYRYDDYDDDYDRDYDRDGEDDYTDRLHPVDYCASTTSDTPPPDSNAAVISLDNAEEVFAWALFIGQDLKAVQPMDLQSTVQLHELLLVLGVNLESKYGNKDIAAAIQLAPGRSVGH